MMHKGKQRSFFYGRDSQVYGSINQKMVLGKILLSFCKGEYEGAR